MSDNAAIDPRVQQALDRFTLAVEAEQKQRDRELAALKFARGRQEDQWTEEAIRERSGRGAGASPAVAPRPILTINKLKQPLDQLENQAKASRLSIHFAPNSDDADPETAEVYEDVARAVQVDSRAHIARNWAFRRAIRGGRGAYRINVEYANDGDFDLDIVYKRILDQGAVYLDPFAQEPDFCDMEWALITSDLPWSRYVREFKDSTLATYDDDELVALGNEKPGWVSGEKEARSVRIAEYFAVEYDEEELTSEDGERTRIVEKRTVKWLKINALEVLEETEWNGRYIPIVPVVADEDVADGERSWTGIVEPAMDAQRSYNVMRSAEIEAIGLAPKAPYVGYEGQFEGHEDKWNTANVRNWSYLEARPVTLDGKPAPLPQRNVQEPAIQAIALSTRQASDDVHATTGVPPVALGTLDPHERSGKAIKALQQMSEQGTSGYLDNLASISMLYEGKILRDLIPKVYDRPGRIVHAIGADDQRRSVMLNAPFVMQNGRPVIAPAGTPKAKTYDLAKGQYTVSVKVGKSYTTKREQGAAAIGELIQAAPQLIGVLGDIYVGELDFPGARQAADRLKKMLPPQLQDNQDGGQLPPQAQQQIAQMEQMIDALSKELTAKTQLIETDAVKAQQQLAIEQTRQTFETERTKAELGTKLHLERLKIAADLIKTKATLERDEADAMLDAKMRQLDQGVAMAGDQAEREHESQEADLDRAHAAGEADRDRSTQTELAQLSAKAAADRAQTTGANARAD